MIVRRVGASHSRSVSNTTLTLCNWALSMVSFQVQQTTTTTTSMYVVIQTVFIKQRIESTTTKRWKCQGVFPQVESAHKRTRPDMEHGRSEPRRQVGQQRVQHRLLPHQESAHECSGRRRLAQSAAELAAHRSDAACGRRHASIAGGHRVAGAALPGHLSLHTSSAADNSVSDHQAAAAAAAAVAASVAAHFAGDSARHTNCLFVAQLLPATLVEHVNVARSAVSHRTVEQLHDDDANRQRLRHAWQELSTDTGDDGDDDGTHVHGRLFSLQHDVYSTNVDRLATVLVGYDKHDERWPLAGRRSNSPRRSLLESNSNNNNNNSARTDPASSARSLHSGLSEQRHHVDRLHIRPPGQNTSYANRLGAGRSGSNMVMRLTKIKLNFGEKSTR